jgi:hypothetical protein
LLPVTVIELPIAATLVESAKVWGVTENGAAASTPVVGAPNGNMSMKYPPPATSGTNTLVVIAPPPSEAIDNTPPEQLVE